MPLSDQEPRKGRSVAMFDDPDGLTGVAVDDDHDVAVAPAEAGLDNEEDPAAATLPISANQIRPRAGQSHDVMPSQSVPAGHFPY